MAANNLNKAHVYDLLGRLNASFARVARNLADLERVGPFEIYKIRRLHFQSKELQANSNLYLLETLRDIEQRDWARFGKVRNVRDGK